MKNIQKIFAAGMLLSGAFLVSNVSAYVLDFENYVSGTNTYAQGSVPEGTSETSYVYTHSFNSACGTISLNSDWADWGTLYGRPVSWSWNGGFTISNVNAEDTTNSRTSADGKSNGAYAYSSNTYAAVAGAANYPTEGYGITVSGSQNSAGYAVMLGSATRGTVGGTVTFENSVSLKSLDFTNPAGALNIVTYGSNFNELASEDNWAAVIVRGWNSDGILVGQKTMMLYDYLTGENMVTNWTEASFENISLHVLDAEYFGTTATDPNYLEIKETVENAAASNDFSTLVSLYSAADYGSFKDVSKLTFSFDGSDYGNWGLNFPAYFALDNLTYEYSLPSDALPEPAAWILCLLGLLLLPVRKFRRTELAG